MYLHDLNHVLYQLTLGKSSWDLRTWLLLNNVGYLQQRFHYDITGLLSDFYTKYNRHNLTPDVYLYHGVDHHALLAAEKGHLETFHTKLNVTNYDEIMIEATENGHIEIVKLMLDKGATDYNEAMRSAAWGGYVDIIQLMLEKGATNYDDAMINAANGGQLGIVKWMVGLGVIFYREAMIDAAEQQKIEVVEYLLSLNVLTSEDLEFCMVYAGQPNVTALIEAKMTT